MGVKPLPKLLNLNVQDSMYNLLMQYKNYFHFIVMYLKCSEWKVFL